MPGGFESARYRNIYYFHGGFLEHTPRGFEAKGKIVAGWRGAQISAEQPFQLAL